MITSTLFFRKITSLALIAAGVLTLGGALALAQSRSDSQIEMDVVQALDSSSALKDDLITAATIQSEVTLSGTVSSDKSKKLAESLCSHVAGVSKVHNNLKVGDPKAAQADTGMQPQDSYDQGAPDQGGYQGTANPPQGQVQQNYPPQQQGSQQYPQARQPYPQQQGQTYPQQGQQYPQGQPYPQQGQQYPQGQQTYPQQGQPYPSQQAQGPYGQPARPPYPGRGQYPPQQQPYPDGGGQPYPDQAPQGYQQMPTPSQNYDFARGPITLLPGTTLQLRTIQPVSAKHAQEGQPVDFQVMQDIGIGNTLAIPRGATVHGVVTFAKRAGQLGGSAELALRLVALELSGRAYPLQSDQFYVKGPNKGGQTAGSIVGGAILGAIIGGAVGRGTGAAIGAGAGAAAGTAASAASSGPDVWIPSEAQVTFRLTAPVTIDAVSPQEANSLAQGLYQGGPNLYRRTPPTLYGGRYVQAAPVYYRPYYTVGGAYYWR